MVSTFSEAASVVQNTITKSYPQVKKAYIFGSFADGAHNSESDLDVLVELDNAMGLQFISLIQDLEKASGTSVDIITVEQAKNLEEKFGYEILRKARSIYERSSNWEIAKHDVTALESVIRNELSILKDK